MPGPASRARTRRLTTLAALLLAMACSETPTAPDAAPQPAPSLDVTTNSYASGAHVLTWDPIIPAAADPNWTTTICTSQPLVGPDANWQNPHNAFVLTGHPWAFDFFFAPWINAWNSLGSMGPAGQNWTKYETEVAGNGTFVIRLLADNCSWIYLDGTLVGVQGVTRTPNSYGLTLNGTHTLSFVIFDGGGAAGGKFLLETTSNPPPPLNPDLDGDTHPNDDDAFPLDPTEWDDTDGDGVGDNSDAFPNDPTRTEPDPDSDGDGVNDDIDNCAAVANPDQADLDGDGQGDACDADDDNDGVNDVDDAFPADPSESADSDGDGVGDNADAFPNDPSETSDADGDGVGDNADAFDGSDMAPTVVIGTCNSGVANQHLGDGSWFNDLIGVARSAARNHGQFVNAVSSLSNGWKKAGLISGREHGAIVSCAARSK